MKNVSCEYDWLNGWNSTLQATWYIRHVRIIWFLRTKPTIWSLILSFTQNIVRACSIFYPWRSLGYTWRFHLQLAAVPHGLRGDRSKVSRDCFVNSSDALGISRRLRLLVGFTYLPVRAVTLWSDGKFARWLHLAVSPTACSSDTINDERSLNGYAWRFHVL